MAEATLAAELVRSTEDSLLQRRDALPSRIPIVPVPTDASVMKFRHPKHGEPSASWAYRKSDGGLIGYVCRWNFKKPDGTPDKTYLPICFCNLGGGHREWRSVGFPEPRPLYRLPDILARPDATILVAEGEKACDAATPLFPDFVVTTPPHGAKSPQKADWSLLRGRKVVIWPDHDEAGYDFAKAVAGIAIEASAASVQIVDIPADFPDKWDLANVLPEGWTESDREALLSDATPFEAELGNGEFSDKPIANGIPERFRLSGNGVSFKEDNDSHWESVCSRLEVVAVTRDTSGEAWGRLLRITDRDGNLHEWAMPMAMLAADGADYRRHLLSLGLEIAPGIKARNRLHEYISRCRPKERALCVARIGWHGDVFVLPNSTIGDTGGERIVLQLEGRTDHAFYKQGELTDWQSHVGQYAAGNSRLVTAISIALAGPLLHVIDAESGGFHFRGPSSVGKTTALAVAGSVWGGGGVTGYIKQWRATDNGLEAVAQGHCDTFLCLDELSQIDPKAAGACAYILANGAGKSRAGRAGEGRKPAEWRVMFLSTGEIGIADKVAEDGRGRKVTAGQKVRVIDIPADAEAGRGLFEKLHDFDSPDAFARHLRQAANEFYGEPARAFLSAITQILDEVRETVPGFIDEYVAEHCPKHADGQVQRVAQRFALVAAAGELATDLGVLPWASGEATKGVAACFNAWLAARGDVGPAEIAAAIAQVRYFIEQHGEGRFTPWDSSGDRQTINRAGFRRSNDNGGSEYFIYPEVWKAEVCKGFDPGMVANALADLGILIPDNADKKTSESAPAAGPQEPCPLLSACRHHPRRRYRCVIGSHSPANMKRNRPKAGQQGQHGQQQRGKPGKAAILAGSPSSMARATKVQQGQQGS